MRQSRSIIGIIKGKTLLVYPRQLGVPDPCCQYPFWAASARLCKDDLPLLSVQTSEIGNERAVGRKSGSARVGLQGRVLFCGVIEVAEPDNGAFLKGADDLLAV